MPKVTPHICRHTFCSRMASAGMNPKTLQYIMGHSDIGAILNTYTYIGFEDAADEMSRITKDGGEKISKPDTDNVRDFLDYRDEASNG